MSGTVFEIPLSPQAQKFSISLAGVQYNFLLVYRNINNGGWVLDIADGNNNPMVCGIPFVTGTDLLGQYAYLGFGGQLFVQTDGAPDAPPVYENLGVSGHLYWIPN